MSLKSAIIIWDMVTAAIWAILTIIILFIAFALFSIGEMAGPRSFAPPLLFVIIVMLVVATCTSELEAGVLGGIASGLTFSCPIMIFCQWLAHSEPDILRWHGGQLLFCGITTIVLAPFVMGYVAHLRKIMAKNSASSKKHDQFHCLR